MVTLDRGLHEAAALLYEIEQGIRENGGAAARARVELAIMAVERARALLGEQAGEILRHEDW
jgi:hypothetical protein